eukprot:tig00000863_g5011.t1
MELLCGYSKLDGTRWRRAKREVRVSVADSALQIVFNDAEKTLLDRCALDEPLKGYGHGLVVLDFSQRDPHQLGFRYSTPEGQTKSSSALAAAEPAPALRPDAAPSRPLGGQEARVSLRAQEADPRGRPWPRLQAARAALRASAQLSASAEPPDGGPSSSGPSPPPVGAARPCPPAASFSPPAPPASSSRARAALGARQRRRHGHGGICGAGGPVGGEAGAGPGAGGEAGEEGALRGEVLALLADPAFPRFVERVGRLWEAALAPPRP